jgi:hypothetical protein
MLVAGLGHELINGVPLWREQWLKLLGGAWMSTRLYELTDFEWSIIEPLLSNNPRGECVGNDLREISGRIVIIHVFTTRSDPAGISFWRS